MVVTVWVAPALSVSSTATTLPAGASEVPVICGVLSLVLSGASTVMCTAGGVGFSSPPPPEAAAAAASGSKASSHKGLGAHNALMISPPKAWPACTSSASMVTASSGTVLSGT